MATLINVGGYITRQRTISNAKLLLAKKKWCDENGKKFYLKKAESEVSAGHFYNLSDFPNLKGVEITDAIIKTFVSKKLERQKLANDRKKKIKAAGRTQNDVCEPSTQQLELPIEQQATIERVVPPQMEDASLLRVATAITASLINNTPETEIDESRASQICKTALIVAGELLKQINKFHICNMM
jgi:hypothetical protein